MIDPIGACLWLFAAVAGIALTGAVTARALDRSVGAGGRAGVASSLGHARIDRWLVSFGLGTAAWIVLLFALAAAGALSRAPILALAIALPALGLALEGRRLASRSPGPGPEPWKAVAPNEGPEPRPAARLALALAAVAVTAAVLGVLARALIPDVSWDADVYHLTVPRIYLEHGGFVRIPFNVYSNWPLGIELLFGAAMALRDFVLAKLLHLAFGVLAAVLAWRLAGPRTSTVAGVEPSVAQGAVAAALFLANPVVLAEMAVAYVDLASAFFLLLGFGALDRGLSARGLHPRTTDDLAPLPDETRAALLLAGICAGALCAIKVTGFVAAGCLATLFVLEAWRARWPWRSVTRALVRLAIPAALLFLPWLVKSAILTGNPVYPFLHTLLGGPEWSAALSEELARWQRAIGMGRGPVDYLLLPLRVALEGGTGYDRFDGRIAPFWLLLVPLSAWAALRDEVVRRALFLAALSFAVWAVSSQQMRFLVPAVALLAVAAARALGELVRALGRWPGVARAAAPAPALLASGLLLWYAWPWGRVALDNAPALARHYAEMRAELVEPAHRFVDERLPADARLLLLDHNRGFHLHRAYVADSFLEASQIGELFRGDDAAAAARRLARMRITHVLREARRPGARYPQGLLEVVEAAPLLYRSPDGRIEVRELEAGGAGSRDEALRPRPSAGATPLGPGHNGPGPPAPNSHE
ncbi:MAG TPA: hypothetical protein VMT85_14060 [Thermoanaerobaculia bacterium]|nr:hypothetical protein [Thermoanaerobaculia bacterium]